MAVRIPVYNQQTSTPNARLAGGQLTTDVGPNIGGALRDIAGGLAVMGQRVDDEKESIASTWASEQINLVQREAPAKEVEFKANAGEGGAGVADAMDSWMKERVAAIEEAAPTEKSRAFIRERLGAYGTQMYLRAFDYQQQELVSYTDNKWNLAGENAGKAAAQNPGAAPTIIAETIAALRENTILSPEQKRAKEQTIIETVSYFDQKAETLRKPYETRKGFLWRLGMGPEATSEEVMQSAESAASVLEAIEADSGFKVPDEMRGDAITNLMAGGRISFDKKTGETVFVGKGSGTEGGSMTLNALPVNRVVELLGLADAEIAKIENEKAQQAMAGKVTFAQQWRDTQVALANGDPVQLPSRAVAAQYYKPEEVDIMYRQAEVLQASAGTLKLLDGQTNAELDAVIMSPPVGSDNREATQEAYNARRARALQIKAARDADPGAYAMTTSAPVKAANAAYSDAAQRAANGDAAAAEQIPGLLRNYISVSMGEQARLGIANPALPKQFVDAIVTDFNKTIRDNPQQAAGNLQFLATMLDGMPDTRGAIAAKVGTVGQFAMEGVAPQVVKKLWEASQVKEAQVKENIPTDIPWATVLGEVQNSFAPMGDAMGTNLQDFNRYVQAGQKLAANYLATGVYTNAKDAANAAYTELFADYNDIAEGGKYYIPKGQGYDPAAVQVGLAQYVATLSGEDLFVEDSGRPLAEARMAKARTVRNQAFWRNNADDTGAILYAPGGIVVKDENGLPIEVKFADAQMIKPEAPKRKEQSPYSGLR